ncbi:MAG: MarC family protein [Gammaproteobacteria bacterium]|nr:MarC family protein [Gammaproteobacteria bacterium]
MNVYTATITLILVMDPLGNIPLFLSILNSVDVKRRKRIILRETFIAFLILMLFLFFGKYMLKSMNISGPALSVSGGIILFLIAIKMIFPTEENPQRTHQMGEPFIVPLAIPLIAGPSALAFVMLLANQDPGHIAWWALALFIASMVSTTLLVFADTLRNILGQRGLVAIERLMGMILTTMAVQMFLNGLQEFFHLQ